MPANNKNETVIQCSGAKQTALVLVLALALALTSVLILGARHVDRVGEFHASRMPQPRQTLTVEQRPAINEGPALSHPESGFVLTLGQLCTGI